MVTSVKMIFFFLTLRPLRPCERSSVEATRLEDAAGSEHPDLGQQGTLDCALSILPGRATCRPASFQPHPGAAEPAAPLCPGHLHGQEVSGWLDCTLQIIKAVPGNMLWWLSPWVWGRRAPLALSPWCTSLSGGQPDSVNCVTPDCQSSAVY